MIAYSLGGIEGSGPQRPENLVVGTAECNSHMIIAEEMIKQVVRQTAKATHPSEQLVTSLEAWVTMADPERHIAQHIRYTFKLADGEGKGLMVMHFDFNALTRAKPLEGKNRVVRHWGDVHYAKGAGKRKRYPKTTLADLHPLRERPIKRLRPDGTPVPVPEDVDESGLPLMPDYDYTDPADTAM